MSATLLARRPLTATLRSAWRALDWRRDARRIARLFREDRRPLAAPTTPLRVDPISLALQQAQADVAQTSLLIARESLPDLDLEAALATFEAHVEQARQALQGRFTGAERVAALRELLFGRWGLQASDARDLASLQADLFLPEVLRRRRGHCVGLSCLLLALAQRLELPIFAVAAPGHVFCRYDDGDERINIELTQGGADWSDARYQRKTGLTDEAVAQGVYLGNLEPRDLLVEVLNNRGHIAWRRGLADDAARDLMRATRASRGFARAHAAKGFMALCRGRPELAIVELGRAVEIDPWSARSTLYLGEALLDAGLHRRAIAALRQAVELDAESAFAWSLLGRALLQERRVEEAEAAHREALARDPEGAVVRTNWGVFLAVTGSIEDAIDAFVQAWEAAPELAAPAENLVRLASLGRLGDYAWIVDEVLEAAAQRIADHPSDRRALLSLARLHWELGEDLDRVEELALRARALKEEAQALELLAEVAYRRQQLARAQRLARKGLASWPAARTRTRLRRLLDRIDASWRWLCEAEEER